MMSINKNDHHRPVPKPHSVCLCSRVTAHLLHHMVTNPAVYSVSDNLRESMFCYHKLRYIFSVHINNAFNEHYVAKTKTSASFNYLM